MARTSRILFPAGTRYVPIYEPLIKKFGFQAAAILGLLEFLDRAQDLPMQPLASRARVIADLEGIEGKGSIDAGLKKLLDENVIVKHASTTFGKRNWETRVYYCLNADALNEMLGTTKTGSHRESQKPYSREVPIPEPETGPETEAPSYIRERINEAAALRASDAAPAANLGQVPAKSRERRPSGIVTWLPDDIAKAAQLETTHALDTILIAVQTLENAGKQPVPGLVSQAIERAQRRIQNQEQIAAEQASIEAEQVRKEAIEQTHLKEVHRLLQQLPEDQLNELATFIATNSWETTIARHRHGARSKVLSRNLPTGIERQILFRSLDALGLVTGFADAS